MVQNGRNTGKPDNTDSKKAPIKEPKAEQSKDMLPAKTLLHNAYRGKR